MSGKLVSSVIQKLAKCLAGSDCGEDAVEDVGGGGAEFASDERLMRGYFRSDRDVKCSGSRVFSEEDAEELKMKLPP